MQPLGLGTVWVADILEQLGTSHARERSVAHPPSVHHHSHTHSLRVAPNAWQVVVISQY